MICVFFLYFSKSHESDNGKKSHFIWGKTNRHTICCVFSNQLTLNDSFFIFLLTCRIGCDSMQAMKNAITIFARLRSMSLPLFALLVSAYFAAHGLNSVTSQKLLEQEIAALEAERQKIKAVRDGLELHVDLLSSDHVDPDYLDELARRELGYAHPDEILISNK